MSISQPDLYGSLTRLQPSLMYSQLQHTREEYLIVMARSSYWFAPRPPDVTHHHPFLVFDLQDRLHFHLTVYEKEAVACLSRSSAQTYLHAILPWFAYL